MPCKGTNRHGQPCAAPEWLLNDESLCLSHREGGLERMRAVAALGGRASKAKRELSKPLHPRDLRKINTLAQARHRLNFLTSAVLTGRITHNQASAATKAVAEWIRAYQVGLTEELVTKLQVELQEKEKEIAALKARSSLRIS